MSAHFPKGGDALDVAGGLGRHALWLAKRHWNVTVVDISAIAIAKLAENAHHERLTLNLIALDLKDYVFRPAQFDLVVIYYHFDRDLVPKILSTLRPGGLVLCKSSVMFAPYHGAAPQNLKPLAGKEIISLLPTLRVLHHQERPVRDRGVVEYIGQKLVSA